MRISDWSSDVCSSDLIVEEADGQVHVDASAIASLAVRIHRATVPNRLQRINGRGDNAAIGLAIRCRNKADAASIRFEFRAIHALAGDALAFGFVDRKSTRLNSSH